ncbi:glycosyltransferase family 4 protein [Cohnella zeiphila]|uniref:Glycosyltransferase family 4 protein n=1 Tax=Cohnella zeiphila TaxID=2761120 RepID=A0A7X0VYV6_9BACL|nr:glycosyltransferase family 4 protein [Cohnella zeiphila]MBB6735115.1 glycosyltransferase family 4 protein [Cohnella zeiphila]
MSEKTVYMWPKISPHNKYTELLSRSIERRGLRVAHYDRKAMFKPGKGDIVHMHWPSYTYQASVFPLTLAKSLFFMALLYAYKSRGVRLYWTIHNIWPHNGKSRWDALMRRRLLRLCDSAFVLSDSVRREAAAAFGTREDRLVVTPHGHYVGAYSGRGTDIRSRFGIPRDRFLFLFIGRINPYKGVDRLIEAYRRLEPGTGALLIAGQADSGYPLESLAAGDDSIKVHPEFVDDGELSDFMEAADAVVLPYRQITTSGSAILALSYKKPVVAPRLGSLGEYVSEGCGVLYDPDDPDGLRKALLEAAKLDKEETEKRIEAKLGELDWDRIAGKMMRVYDGSADGSARQEVRA